MPNLDIVVPAKEFADDSHHGQGPCQVQEQPRLLSRWPAVLSARKPRDAWVEIPFAVTKKEPRRLLLSVTRANDYGIYQAYLNGVKIGAAARSLFIRGLAIGNVICWISGPNQATTHCGWNASGRTRNPLAIIWDSKPFVCGNAGHELSSGGMTSDRAIWQTDPVLYH